LVSVACVGWVPFSSSVLSVFVCSRQTWPVRLSALVWSSLMLQALVWSLVMRQALAELWLEFL
jgi:hypothetical protein